MKKMDDKDFNKYEIKWRPLVDGIFRDIKNPVLIRLICYYSEWFSSDCKDGELSKKFVEIKEKLLDWERIEDVGKFYNSSTGIFEYKLSDEELLKLFEIEFLSLVDKVWMREYLLNNLLK